LTKIDINYDRKLDPDIVIKKNGVPYES